MMLANNPIVSKDNDLIKKIVKLANNRGYRYQEKLAIIYGEHLVEEALKTNILDSLIVTNSGIKKYANMVALVNQKKVIVIDESLLTKVNLLESMVDILGIILIKEPQLKSNLEQDDCIILEEIQDPGNLGAMLRLASAAGINNVILSMNCVDIYNPKVLRASQGAQFKLNIYQNVDLDEFIHNYRGLVIATAPAATENLYALNLIQNQAWVFGNEGAGLSPELLNQIKIQVQIPMPGHTESLNIAVAAGVCLFEAVRQRLHLCK